MTQQAWKVYRTEHVFLKFILFYFASTSLASCIVYLCHITDLLFWRLSLYCMLPWLGQLIFTVLKDVSSESCLYLTSLGFFYTLGRFLRKKKILCSCMNVLDDYGWHFGPTDFGACRQYRNLLSNLWDETHDQAAGGGHWRYCCLCNIINMCLDIFHCR